MWKRILGAVGGLIVLAGLLVAILPRKASAIPDRIDLVCVETGRQVTRDRDEIRRIPAPNPDTGRRTMFPVARRDGRLFVDSHYAPLVRAMEATAYVDAQTLEIRPPG